MKLEPDGTSLFQNRNVNFSFNSLNVIACNDIERSRGFESRLALNLFQDYLIKQAPIYKYERFLDKFLSEYQIGGNPFFLLQIKKERGTSNESKNCRNCSTG